MTWADCGDRAVGTVDQVPTAAVLHGLAALGGDDCDCPKEKRVSSGFDPGVDVEAVPRFWEPMDSGDLGWGKEAFPNGRAPIPPRVRQDYLVRTLWLPADCKEDLPPLRNWIAPCGSEGIVQMDLVPTRLKFTKTSPDSALVDSRRRPGSAVAPEKPRQRTPLRVPSCPWSGWWTARQPSLLAVGAGTASSTTPRGR